MELKTYGWSSPSSFSLESFWASSYVRHCLSTEGISHANNAILPPLAIHGLSPLKENPDTTEGREA
jgi:hypothetical protein